MVAQSGMVLPMQNPLQGNAPVANQPVDAQPEVAEPNLTPEEQAEILANAQEAINSMQNVNIDTNQIINDFNADQQRRLAEAERDEINQLQWQNTIRVGNPNFPVAVYNKDFITASSLLINLVAINVLNNKLHECRVNHIYASLIENGDELITLLEQAQEEKDILDQEWLTKDLFGKIASKFQKSPYVKGQELDDFIEKEHNFIGYNPFKQDLLGTLGATVATQKITSFAESKFLAKNSCKHEAFCSFTQDDHGNLHEHPGVMFPVSATSAAKWWFFPGLATEIGDMIPDHPSINRYYKGFLQNLCKPALTKDQAKELYAILHSPITNFIIQIVALGLGTKMMNDMYQARWRTHISDKQDQLIELLYALKNTKSSPEKSRAKEIALYELKQFVIEGNTLSTLTKLSSWNLLKEKAFSTLTFYRSLPIWGVIAWNWRHEIAARLNIFKNVNNNNNNNDDND